MEPSLPATDALDGGDSSSAPAVWRRCDNTGRWGPDDQLGTLNHITADVRRRAAALVVDGLTVSMAKDIDTVAGPVNPRPAWHVMHLETERPYATADSLHLQIHGLASTHLDALGHMFFDGVGYNGRRQSDIVRAGGLTANGIEALRDGIFTRGVLLDVAATMGAAWLPPGQVVTRDLLEAAELRSGVRVRPGDAVVVHVGLEAREAEQGPENPAERAGLDLSAVEWLFDRSVAVYSGDCIERFPTSDGPLEMPLHQIGIAAMGLTLLDCPSLTRLVELLRARNRSDFLLVAAPLRIPGGTGSPVNPMAVL